MAVSNSGVRPKPGFGIGKQNQGSILVQVLDSKNFFQNCKFSNFLMFFCFLGGYRFLKIWKWTQFGLKGPFRIEKIPHTTFHLKCGFGIGYGMGWKCRPIWISVSVSNLNQSSGFGRTLCNSHCKSQGLNSETVIYHFLLQFASRFHILCILLDNDNQWNNSFYTTNISIEFFTLFTGV